MINVTLNIGGELSPGDIVGIAYNNSVSFGRYVERGLYGSLKYINFKTPIIVNDNYQNYIKGDITRITYFAKKFDKGFQFKNIHKDYITTFGKFDNRAFKISNPEEFFKGTEQEEDYLASKKILTDLKFPAK